MPVLKPLVKADIRALYRLRVRSDALPLYSSASAPGSGSLQAVRMAGSCAAGERAGERRAISQASSNRPRWQPICHNEPAAVIRTAGPCDYDYSYYE